jgi:hypothetical protein
MAVARSTLARAAEGGEAGAGAGPAGSVGGIAAGGGVAVNAGHSRVGPVRRHRSASTSRRKALAVR